MFMAVYVFIVTNRKQPKCPSTGKEVNKTWYTHTPEYSSVTKRNNH